MFFSTKNDKGKDQYTFTCTLSGDCDDKTGISSYDKAFDFQKKHDAKRHPEHKRTN